MENKKLVEEKASLSDKIKALEKDLILKCSQ